MLREDCFKVKHLGREVECEEADLLEYVIGDLDHVMEELHHLAEETKEAQQLYVKAQQETMRRGREFVMVLPGVFCGEDVPYNAPLDVFMWETKPEESGESASHAGEEGGAVMSESFCPSSALHDDITLALSSLENLFGLFDAAGSTAAGSMDMVGLAYELLNNTRDKLLAMVESIETKVGRIEFLREDVSPGGFGPILDVVVTPAGKPENAVEEAGHEHE